MNRQQQIAYDNPCHRAYETCNPKFGFRVGEYSVLLTVNK